MSGATGTARAPASPVITPSAPAISARGLRVRRGADDVLHGVSLTVPRGQIAGLFGPSGSGKTTLMRALVGVQRGVSGSVQVLGHAAGSAQLRRRIGYVTQETSVYLDLSVAENLRYFAALMGAGAENARRALAAVGLTEVAERPVHALSGGQQVRVSLAAALVGDPELLVLDEPTVGLDPLLRRDLWALFRRLAGDRRTLLVSSHVMDEARHCDTLMLLRDGRLIWHDSPAALTTATATADLDAAFIRIIEQGSAEW
ncbi:MAG TPA: ABC transporter ATP-binding protein [Solirubrobacteraceae bacterium]|nr:ABC transporter ATP-binding protein [Solirubrobacteraceae bacterium]